MRARGFTTKKKTVFLCRKAAVFLFWMESLIWMEVFLCSFSVPLVFLQCSFLFPCLILRSSYFVSFSKKLTLINSGRDISNVRFDKILMFQSSAFCYFVIFVSCSFIFIFLFENRRKFVSFGLRLSGTSKLTFLRFLCLHFGDSARELPFRNVDFPSFTMSFLGVFRPF